jgi:hypothetical protein
MRDTMGGAGVQARQHRSLVWGTTTRASHKHVGNCTVAFACSSEYDEWLWRHCTGDHNLLAVSTKRLRPLYRRLFALPYNHGPNLYRWTEQTNRSKCVDQA